MFPWEHLAVGYLGYSLAVHLVGRGPPRSWPVVALAFGTQFPDLVDKPLAWTLGVLPSGHSLAHSLFVAVPVCAAAVAVSLWHARGRASGRTGVGVAFVFGYLSHLPTDVFYPVLVGSEPNYDFLLWPLVPAVESADSASFVEMFRTLVGRYVAELARGEIGAYLVIEFGLFASVVLLWTYDGMPPLRSMWSWFGAEREVEETP